MLKFKFFLNNLFSKVLFNLRLTVTGIKYNGILWAVYYYNKKLLWNLHNPLQCQHCQHCSLPGAEQICSLCSAHREDQYRLCSVRGREQCRLCSAQQAKKYFLGPKIGKNVISASSLMIVLSNNIYPRSLYDISDHFWGKIIFCRRVLLKGIHHLITFVNPVTFLYKFGKTRRGRPH